MLSAVSPTAQMTVSLKQGVTMDGQALLAEIAVATGLPEDWVRRKLHEIMLSAGINPDKASLADIREVLAALMQDVLLEAKARLGASPQR